MTSSSPNSNSNSAPTPVDELRAVLRRTASSQSEDNTFAGDAAAPPQSKPREEAAAKPTRGRRDPTAEKRPLGDIVREAGRSALGGGLPGAMAMAIQVVSLMWLRTAMNYQYRYGLSTKDAIRTLYKEGGIPRFYRGLAPALIQGPLSRFGDTASNAGMMSLLNQQESTKNLPIPVKTAAASATAGLFRIVLMPVDAFKTILQVEGVKGLPLIQEKIRVGGPQVLFHGALGAAGATALGHWPWFATFNTLSSYIPEQPTLWGKLLRNAGIGFCSSMVSDCLSNSIRVVKTTKQTYPTPISYPQAVRMIVDADGVKGLFLRGLGTRLIANGFQAALFTVLWKGLEERFFKKEKSASSARA